MNTRTLFVLGALIAFATPAFADEPVRVVEIRQRLRSPVGSCTYTAEITGRYRAAPGARDGEIRDAIVDVTSRFECRHRPPVVNTRGIYFAAARPEDIAGRVADAATVQYSPRPGTMCIVAPEVEFQANGPVFTDLSMHCTSGYR